MIEVVRYQQDTAGGRLLLRLVECPACGADLTVDWRGDGTVPDHVASHDPEDFGLAPLGERR